MGYLRGAMAQSSLVATRWATVLVGLVLSGFGFLEKLGKTTSDTKTPLIEEPALFLEKSLGLWNPSTSLGELQNQAYGYLFPQGPFFLLGSLAHVPPWIVERGWTVLVLLIGCEGARLVARAMGMEAWPAWFAGMAYGLNPHVLAQVGTRSAEVLPGAVLPWALLPVVLAITGRLGTGRAMLFSVVAFTFAGAVNGTATGAPLVLVVVLLGWGVSRGLLRWRALAGWAGLVVLTSTWWVASLLRLNSYAPPFFDYVEDARATTTVTGASASLRGLSNWVNYTYLGDQPNWPAGFDLAYEPYLVLATSLVATVGVLGLVTWRSPWRAPMLLGAVIGLGLLTAGHSSWLGSPVAAPLQDLLDGPFALLRNVHKVDPVLRLPIALGVGVAFARATAMAARPTPLLRRRLPRLIAPWMIGLLTLGLAQPAVAMNLRTPGWDETPDYWQQAADFLADAPAPSRAWVVPGSGFGVQTWGWTMDEPIQAVATTDWLTRSQVPLTPPTTIRMLDELEKLLEDGTGSPYLGTMLARLDIGYVLVRHDLDPGLTEAPLSQLTSLAIGRSNGLERVAAFGAVDLGPAVEIYRVEEAQDTGEFSATALDDVVTVGGTSSDVIQAIGRGVVDEGPAVVQGDNGWSEAADVVGDSFRDVERDFGRVHDAESHVRSVDEPSHSKRVVTDYPGSEGSRRVEAVYDDLRYVDASSSASFPDTIGTVRPENAPYSAFDGDVRTGWRSSYFAKPVGQWVEAVAPEDRRWWRVGVLVPVWERDEAQIGAVRIRAGDTERRAVVDPFTGRASVNLAGVSADRVRITVDALAEGSAPGPVSIAEVTVPGLATGRTLVVPDYSLSERPTFLFSASPETRACVPTLLGPDCKASRARQSDESQGIDRTITVPAGGEWDLSGVATARTTDGAMQLLDPILGTSEVVMRGSTTFENDPAVSARFAYDADPLTSWIADPYDPNPTLSIDFSKRRRVESISVARPASPGVTPTTAVIRSGNQSRTVQLGQFGGTFEPLHAKHLDITFSNATRYGAPIGVGDVVFEPVDVQVPLDGSLASGSVCGYGPELRVDGRRYRTRATGPLGNIASGGPLTIVPCEGPVRMSAGTHRVQVAATLQFGPVSATLTPTEGGVTSRGDVTRRSVEVLEQEDSRQVVRLGPGPGAVLATGRNINAGWVARLDGEVLPVQRVDGWAQGWIVPAGAGGEVEVSYAPEESYVAILLGGLVVTAAVLLLALVLLALTRLRPGTQPALVERGRTRRGRSRVSRVLSPLAIAGCVVLAIALSGITGALAAVVLGLTVWLRWPPRAVASVLLGTAAVVAAAVLVDGKHQEILAADLLAGAGFLVALGDLAWPGGRSRRAPRQDRAPRPA